MNEFDLAWIGMNEAPWANKVSAFLERVLVHLGIQHWEVSVGFYSPREMQTVNAKFRKKDEATDVLSFPQFEPGDLALEHESEPGQTIAVGDILVCPDIVQANADYFGCSYDEELRRVLVHGLLHLKGLDHKTNDAEEPMLQFQEEILSTLKDYTVAL